MHLFIHFLFCPLLSLVNEALLLLNPKSAEIVHRLKALRVFYLVVLIINLVSIMFHPRSNLKRQIVLTLEWLVTI